MCLSFVTFVMLPPSPAASPPSPFVPSEWLCQEGIHRDGRSQEDWKFLQLWDWSWGLELWLQRLYEHSWRVWDYGFGAADRPCPTAAPCSSRGFSRRSRSSDTGTSRPLSAWTSCGTSPTTAWSTGARTRRVWRRPAASSLNGSPSCAGMCRWACWNGCHRGSTSGPPTTWAETTWRRSWPARRPPTGSASVRCCWDLCRPISSSCQNTRPMHTSSCGGRSGVGGAP